MTIILVIVVAILVLMAAEDLAVPQVADLSCTTWACDFYTAIRDFQTLIGGGLALVAAWLAARPAWLQLQSITLQQEIAARQTIAERLKGIERRMAESGQGLRKFSDDVGREIYDANYDEPYEPSSIGEQWAFNCGHRIRAMIESLVADQALSQDTANIELARDHLISSLEKLGDCFYDISATAQYSGDPDLTPEQEEQLPISEQNARQNLPDMLAKFDMALSAFDEVGRAEIQRFRTRLRRIDDTLLS